MHAEVGTHLPCGRNKRRGFGDLLAQTRSTCAAGRGLCAAGGASRRCKLQCAAAAASLSSNAPFAAPARRMRMRRAAVAALCLLLLPPVAAFPLLYDGNGGALLTTALGANLSLSPSAGGSLARSLLLCALAVCTR